MSARIDEVVFPVGFLTDLAEAASVQRVLDAVAAWLVVMLSADRASVALVGEDRDYLRLFALEGNQAIPFDAKVPMFDTLVGASIGRGIQCYTKDLESNQTTDAQMLWQGGLRSCVNSPLVSSGECFGSVNVASRRPDGFSHNHLATLSGVASLLASHLRVHFMAEEAQRRARTDELTGLLSRRAIMGELSRRLDEEPGPISVLFVDVDNFKLINDVHGHTVGDLVLSQVGGRFAAAVRPSDLVGRIGGDEFLVILEGAGSDNKASVIARRIDRLFRRPVRVGPLDLVVRLSIGFATSAEETRSAASLLTEADLAMYREKQESLPHSVRMLPPSH